MTDVLPSAAPATPVDSPADGAGGDDGTAAVSSFHSLLLEQIGHEFAASQQYVAIAVWYDQLALPRLAAHFYRQAVEERNHAMMIVQYLMDRDVPVTIPGIPAVRTTFDSLTAPVALALQQERSVTKDFERLIRAARDDGDYLGEQFTHWFLKEQVEEVASMTTLLQVAERCKDAPMLLEEYLARESIGEHGSDPTAPPAAGGSL
jgi:ferritin